MKAVSVFLTLIIIENWFFQLQPLAAKQLLNPKSNNRARRQVRLGNYNYNFKWKPNDCKSNYDNYDPGFTRQHDIALFNATPSAHDLTQKYQVMYFPKETHMPGRATLVSSPFLFYKLLLPKPQQHQNGLENLANTGAHLFPTEVPTAADMMPAVTDMAPPVTDMMPTMNATTMDTAPPVMGNMNVQTRSNMWQQRQKIRQNQNLLKSYRNSRPNYEQTNRMQNFIQPDTSYDFFNDNFAQLAYLQNNPQNFNMRFLLEQTPLYRLLPQHKPSNVKRKTQMENKYLPIKALSYEDEQNFPLRPLHMDFFKPPFQASPFMGLTTENDIFKNAKEINDKPPANFVRSQRNPYISRRPTTYNMHA